MFKLLDATPAEATPKAARPLGPHAIEDPRD
jgi:hypothetical protein